MTWKAIGQSITGTSHATTTSGCEDALCYECITTPDSDSVLIVTVSDGAGSALYGGDGAKIVTTEANKYITLLLQENSSITVTNIYAMAEHIYDILAKAATNNDVAIEEESCTMLGAVVSSKYSLFYQIGDGAIIRSNDAGALSTVWWPHNGEYLNTTAFVTDNVSMPDLQIVLLHEEINELALFTDGLQMLTLSMDTLTVHQPFFTGLFHHLRLADTPEKIATLNTMLAQYLDSPAINSRTDDDKTLFLATRLPA